MYIYIYMCMYIYICLYIEICKDGVNQPNQAHQPWQSNSLGPMGHSLLYFCLKIVGAKSV